MALFLKLKHQYGPMKDCVDKWYGALKSEDGNRFSIRTYLSSNDDYSGIQSDVLGLEENFNTFEKYHAIATDFDTKYTYSKEIAFFTALQIFTALCTIASPLLVGSSKLTMFATGGTLFGVTTWVKSNMKEYLDTKLQTFSQIDWIAQTGELHINVLKAELAELHRKIDKSTNHIDFDNEFISHSDL